MSRSALYFFNIGYFLSHWATKVINCSCPNKISLFSKVKTSLSSLDGIKTIRVQQYSSSEQVIKSQRSYDNHRNGVTTIIATELRQSSLRSYGNCRYGVTAIVATGLRQSSLRSYGRCRYETDRHGCSPTP